MHEVRGIADQHQPVCHQRTRQMHLERPKRTRSCQRNLAQPQAEPLLGFDEEGGIVHRHNGTADLLVLRPGDARAVTRERQNRERPGRQEVLHGARAVRLSMRDRGDDANLLVGPADDADAGRIAQTRGAAVRRDKNFGAQAATVVQDSAHAVRSRLVAGDAAAADQRDAGPLRHCRRDGVMQARVLDNEGRRVAVINGVVVANEQGAEHIVERGIGDVDAGNLLRVRGQRGPDAERSQHALRSGRDGGGADISGAAAAAEIRLVDHRDRKRRTEGVGERTGKRQPDPAGAGDHDAIVVRPCVHHTSWPSA